jgi:cytochrome b
MDQNELSIWDPAVRLGHWILVAAFTIAYVTEDDLLSTHVWAGYMVGLVVAFRVLWGFVGPRHARFSDFVYSPTIIISYLTDLIRFRAKRYLGHSPTGGAMVLALLLSLSATVITGLATNGADKKAGPLAPLYRASLTAGSAPVVSGVLHEAAAIETERRGSDENGDRSESVMKELHEFLANLSLVLVLLHVAGVGFASIVHRENLLRAMITGRKEADGTSAEPAPPSALTR